jgi:molybdopterin molybdotransferase
LARLKGFQRLVTVDDALEKFLSAFQSRPKRILVPINSALNRVLAEDIIANTDLPRTDRSAVDGYAVNADDSVGATQSKPRTFRLVDADVLTEKQAKQVWTGNSIPQHANAVVMLENTRQVGKEIEVWTEVTPWENVSRKGEDTRKGEIAVKAGTRLKPQHLGLAAALGFANVRVFEKPRIAILATGDELAELGGPLLQDQIFDTNRLVLSALCTELGAETLDLGIARDNVEEISEKLISGLKKSNAVITSGGTSVGGLDLVPECVNRIGKPGVIVHGVAMRPGMPTALAVVKKKPIIILPGNPAAAMLGFEVFGRPLLSKMLGMKKDDSRPLLKARIARRITTTLGRKNLVRVRVFQKNGEFIAEPISARGSGLISTMTKANGYAIVPENLEGLEEGDIVLVRIFDNLEV